MELESGFCREHSGLNSKLLEMVVQMFVGYPTNFFLSHFSKKGVFQFTVWMFHHVSQGL